jgi:hypothetical protein
MRWRAGAVEVGDLLRLFSARRMKMWTVGKRVNSRRGMIGVVEGIR